MSDYARLKALAIEADRRGDRQTASRAMSKMRELKTAYDAAGVDVNLLEGPKAMSDTEARQQAVKENPWTARAASFQAGARDLGRNLAAMVLPDRLAAAAGVSDDDIRRKREEEAPLRDSHGGFYTAGQIVPTLITAGAGTGGSMLGRAIAANPIKYAMLTGGVQGAAAAGPDDRYTGAALGAATAGAVGKALQVGGRAVSSGFAPATEKFRKWEASMRKLDPNADTFAPVTAAGPKEGRGSLISSLYGKYLRQTAGADDVLLQQERDITGNTLKAATRAAYGQNADDVLNTAMPGGRVTELGGENNFKAALPAGNAAYKRDYDAAILPGARQAFDAAKSNIPGVEQSVQPGLQKAMAQLAKSQQKVADVKTQLAAIQPLAAQADEAAELARGPYLAAKEPAKLAKQAAQEAAERAEKAVQDAANFAQKNLTGPIAEKNSARLLKLATAAENAAKQADDAYKAANQALKDARRLSKSASSASFQKLTEEDALLAAQKSAERGLKSASTRMGNVQQLADEQVAAARGSAANAGRALLAAKRNPGIPSANKPLVGALTQASDTPTGNPTMLGLAKAAEGVDTPQTDVLRNAALGADALTKDAAWKTSSGSRGLSIVFSSAGPVLRKLLTGRGFQNFLLGNTGWQRAIDSAYSSGNGAMLRSVASQAIRAYVATGAGDLTAEARSELDSLMKDFEDSK